MNGANAGCAETEGRRKVIFCALAVVAKQRQAALKTNKLANRRVGFVFIFKLQS